MYKKDKTTKEYNDGISEKTLTEEDIIISEELDFGKEIFDTEMTEPIPENSSKINESRVNSPHKGHRKRMYERYEKNGFNGFLEHEVLEMLLYHGIPLKNTNLLAHEMLKKFGCLKNVIDADVNTLISSGMPPRAALILSQYRELENYLRLNKPSDIYLYTSAETGEFCCERFGYNAKESFSLICLNPKRKVIAVNKISDGKYDSTDSSPGEVIKTALRHNACMVVLCHNHPSGDLNPSTDDYIVTQKIVQLLESVDIGVVDHIICHHDKFTSMFERGILYS
ncbi:MAG: hypothetical protein IJ460_00560 [Clostridia bacterium]|nr:hypothetical protein [Clostridia bacterium]